jgi:predicted ABC-type ATPase
MNGTPPRCIVLGGVNGAGKTTSARSILADTLHVMTFVNADVIAQGLAGFDPDSANMTAGRIMVERLHELAEQRADFAFETTMSGVSSARWLETLRDSGYRIEVYYFWLMSADLAVARVAHRVSRGGHSIPEETVRRRYRQSIQNFFNLYRPTATAWWVYNNSRGEGTPQLMATGNADGQETVIEPATWAQMQKEGEK